MKTNKAMKNLLDELSQSNKFINSDLLNPNFIEWDNCILILSSTIEGEDVVIRFYQSRDNEPEWFNLNDLEGYKEEAILVIEILNVVQ